MRSGQDTGLAIHSPSKPAATPRDASAELEMFAYLRPLAKQLGEGTRSSKYNTTQSLKNSTIDYEAVRNVSCLFRCHFNRDISENGRAAMFDISVLNFVTGWLHLHVNIRCQVATYYRLST